MENYQFKRTVAFKTPLKMPAIIQKMLGADSSEASVTQYMCVDVEKRTVRMWADVAVLGVPLAESSSIQYGYIVSDEENPDEESCRLELTAKSVCTKKLQLGLNKMVEQLIHDGQKATHKLWAEYLMSVQFSPVAGVVSQIVETERKKGEPELPPCVVPALPSADEAASNQEGGILGARRGFKPGSYSYIGGMRQEAERVLHELASQFNEADVDHSG